MDLIADVFGWFVAAYYVLIPFIWAGVFYYKIKCRKIEDAAIENVNTGNIVAITMLNARKTRLRCERKYCYITLE